MAHLSSTIAIIPRYLHSYSVSPGAPKTRTIGLMQTAGNLRTDYALKMRTGRPIRTKKNYENQALIDGISADRVQIRVTDSPTDCGPKTGPQWVHERVTRKIWTRPAQIPLVRAYSSTHNFTGSVLVYKPQLESVICLQNFLWSALDPLVHVLETPNFSYISCPPYKVYPRCPFEFLPLKSCMTMKTSTSHYSKSALVTIIIILKPIPILRIQIISHFTLTVKILRSCKRVSSSSLLVNSS